VLDGHYQDPEKLNELFVQITDDLSYSRTFYPNRSVRVYLNGLAQRIFFRIYKSRRSPIKRLGQFWLDELPQLVYESKREFLLTFLVFVLAFGIGVLSSAMNPEFVNTILGDAYVDMTIQNIESGDPMAVYKQRGKFGMSLGITANNLWVAFLTFVMGVFFSIGSIVIMIQNGIMVGAFQYFFIEKGLFWESFLTIWIHGTLEISAIIIAGAAGITMGKGLVFPGTYTRAQAFQRSARRGVKIMIGIAPIIIMAGFIEGYLTRHTQTPDFIRGLFILVCFLFVVIYFIWYPYIKSKYGFATKIEDAKIPPDNIQKLNFQSIKSSGEIFGDIFTFYRPFFGKIAAIALIGSAIFTGAAFLLSGFKLASVFTFPNQLFGMLVAMPQFFSWQTVPFLPIVNVLIFTALITGIFVWMHQTSENVTYARNKILTAAAKNLFAVATLVLLVQTNGWYVPYLLLIALPIVLLWCYTMQTEDLNLFQGFGRAVYLLQRSSSKIIGLALVLALVSILFFLITDTMILWFYLDLVSWIVNLEAAAMSEVSAILITFTMLFILQMVAGLFVIGFGFLYYTLQEIAEATHLRARIQEIGVAKRIKGLEQEG